MSSPLSLPSTTVPTDDGDLVAALLHGDALALDRALRALYPRIVTVIRAVLVGACPSRVDDLAQRAALRVVTHRRRFDPRRGSLAAWVNTIAGNLARNALRDDRLRNARLARDAELDALPAPTNAWGVDRRAALLAHLDALPAREAEALRARFVEGETWEAASARLGCTVDVLRGRVRAGLASLRAAVEARMTTAFEEIDVANPRSPTPAGSCE
ncbi:MAG: sigma-70 family RNA polymerase sigma factor [Polyangiales bacterium]